MAITNGTYPAKAVGEVVLGKSKEKGTDFIEFYFKIAEGDNKGGLVRYTGYFSEKTAERTLESLYTCGYNGDDPSEFVDGKLHGLDTNEVDIVVELEEYKNDAGETRHAPRVQWVNKRGGYLNVNQRMSVEAASSFGDSMRALVMKAKERRAAKGGGEDPTDFPHGANAPESKRSF